MMTIIAVNTVYQLEQLKKEIWQKNSGLKETRTHDPCDTGAAL